MNHETRMEVWNKLICFCIKGNYRCHVHTKTGEVVKVPRVCWNVEKDGTLVAWTDDVSMSSPITEWIEVVW